MGGFDIRGARPAILEAIYDDDLKDTFEPKAVIDNLVVAPMFTELRPGTPVQLTYDGVAATSDEVADLILRGLQDHIEPDVEAAVHELYGKALCDYVWSPKTLSKEVFANQAAAEANMRPPTPTLYYHADDVIRAAKHLLAGRPTGASELTAAIDYAFTPEVLGFWFLNEQCARDFKDFCAVEAVTRAADMSSDAIVAAQQIPNLDFRELTLGMLLRAKGAEEKGDEEGSFARFIVSCAMRFSAKNPDRMGPMPFTLDALARPLAVVFANVDAHAHSLAPQVRDAWEDVTQAMRNRPQVLSQNQIQNLTAIPAALKRAQKKAAQAQGAGAGGNGAGQGGDAVRRMEARFRRSQPKARDFVKAVKRRLERMASVTASSNSWKEEHRTFMRPSRRDPASPHHMGRTRVTRYRPDIHLYIDTSGSILERHYQAATMASIKLAIALDVDLYFNSFSHVMSRQVKLATKGKTPTEVYRQFAKVQKVGGGTNYEQIWDYIQASPKRRREMSIIITDFEWWVPNHHFEHPKNLYYFPTAADTEGDWDMMVESAKRFCEAMQGEVPDIRGHILF